MDGHGVNFETPSPLQIHLCGGKIQYLILILLLSADGGGSEDQTPRQFNRRY